MIDKINKNKFHFKKNLGQNFLQNDDVLDDIVRFSNIKKDDIVLEIGAGSGALTTHLKDVAKEVISLEIDKTLISTLNNKFQGSNVHIINGDFLSLNTNDLKNFIKVNFHNDIQQIKVCANIPYYITSPIIMKLINDPFYDDITIMIQKEVAMRLLAKPKTSDYGFLTILVTLKVNVNKGFIVPKDNFFPKPKVDSMVINLKKHKPYYDDIFTEKLLKITKLSFIEKRKTLINSLSHNFNIKKEELVTLLNSLNINLNARAEELSLDDFARLTKVIFKI